MSIRSDSWIINKSDLNNYFLNASWGEGLVNKKVPLKVLLDMGVEIAMLADPKAIKELYIWHDGAIPKLLQLYYGMSTAPDTMAFCTKQEDTCLTAPMIYPFVDSSQSKLEYRGGIGKVPSFGISSYGYDIRLSNRFRILDSRKQIGFTSRLDFMETEASQKLEESLFKHVESDCIELLPGQFMLGVSMEHLNMPNNVMATCMQKSTVARKGCLAFVTPIEVSWRGYITLEIFNATDLPMRLYAGQGIMQLIFHEAEERCLVSYADRNGKYMAQPNIPVIGKM